MPTRALLAERNHFRQASLDASHFRQFAKAAGQGRTQAAGDPLGDARANHHNVDAARGVVGGRRGGKRPGAAQEGGAGGDGRGQTGDRQQRPQLAAQQIFRDDFHKGHRDSPRRTRRKLSDRSMRKVGLGDSGGN